MLFYLNKGLILEQVIVQALKTYFTAAGIYDYYRNTTLNITNKHPFAQLFLPGGTNTPARSLFPAIVVATESDSKPRQLVQLADFCGVDLTREDLVPDGEGGKSPLEAKGYLPMPPEKVAALREAVEAQGHLYGVSAFIRRSDRIAIELWSEHIQLKNEW